jgi:hypothetical protein
MYACDPEVANKLAMCARCLRDGDRSRDLRQPAYLSLHSASGARLLKAAHEYKPCGDGFLSFASSEANAPISQNGKTLEVGCE